MDCNELRKHIKLKIEEVTGWETTFTTAVDIQKIPYITFNFAELMTEDRKHTMELTVDAWDKETPFELIQKIDQLDKKFDKYKAMTDKFLVQIYHGHSRQFVEDEDKTIKRLQRIYELIVYERGVQR